MAVQPAFDPSARVMPSASPATARAVAGAVVTDPPEGQGIAHRLSLWSSSLSRTPLKLPDALRQIADTLGRANAEMLFGLTSVIAMVLFYSLADRSPFFILSFAMACWMGSVYAFLRWSWPFGVVAAAGGWIALWKWSREIESQSGPAGKAGAVMLVWPTRALYVLASVSGVILLIVDLPTSKHLLIPFSRPAVEAAPLLLVGIAFGAWLAIDRPGAVDLIKQAAIALAFILWGVDLLMPQGRWATFLGAVVIAIYVFDLAWLMEGHLRKRFAVP